MGSVIAGGLLAVQVAMMVLIIRLSGWRPRGWKRLIAWMRRRLARRSVRVRRAYRERSLAEISVSSNGGPIEIERWHEASKYAFDFMAENGLLTGDPEEDGYIAWGLGNRLRRLDMQHNRARQG